jgi:hypothetical protein
MREHGLLAGRDRAASFGGDTSRDDSDEVTAKLDCSLFLLDRQPLRADVDVLAFGRRLARLIELVAERRDCDHQRADDEVEDIVASHCRTPEDIFAILPRMERRRNPGELGAAFCDGAWLTARPRRSRPPCALIRIL